MSVFHAEKRLTYTVLNVMVLVAIPAMNNGTNIKREDTTALRYNYVTHYFLYYPILFCAILNILFKMFSKGQKIE